MDFKTAVTTCLKEKYASFEGRASRSEYWWFQLFVVLAYLAMGFVAGIAVGIFAAISEDLGAVIYAILCFVVVIGSICPSISVFVRRLHDIGKSGWWYWLALIPFGGIILFIFTLLDSKDDNEYGPRPL